MSRKNAKNQIVSSEEDSEISEYESEESFQSADSASVISSGSEEKESASEGEENFQDSNVEIPESDNEEESKEESSAGSPQVSAQDNEVEESGSEEVAESGGESEEDSPIKAKKKNKKFVVSDSESDEEDNRRKSLYVNREEVESDIEERVCSRVTRRSMGIFTKHESDEESEDDDEELIADDAESEEKNEFLDNEAEESVVESSISEDQNQSRTAFRKSQVSSYSTPEKSSKVRSVEEESINNSSQAFDSYHEKPTVKIEKSLDEAETGQDSKNDISVVESSIIEEQNQSRLFHKSLVSSNSTPSRSKTREHSDPESSFDKSQSLHSIQEPSENKENSGTSFKTSPFSTEKRKSSVLTEVNFHDSIASKLSSTISSAKDQKEIRENSIEIVESKKDVVDLSDSSDSIIELVTSPVVGKRIKETVSRSFYEGEIRKMNDLQNQLVSCSKVLSTASKLPDKGARLRDVVETTKQKIEKLKIDLKKYEIDDNLSVKSEIARSFNDSGNTSAGQPKKSLDKSVEEISWDAINKASDVVPKYTSQKGLQKFQNQQVLTVEKLQTIQESLENCPGENVLAEQPKYLKIDLMNHQKHGLAWMLWREGQRPRGGILADDMGLGKTLSMISLVLAKMQLEENEDEEKEDSDSGSDLEVVEDNAWKAKGRKDFHDGGTLVVCPASLLKQWECEINTRVRRNVLGVYCHHGNSREYKARRLAKYDVVITTYSIVMSEKKNNGCVFGVRWNRIICDEAHTIRNHKSQTSEAVCALKGKYRWALTGTPIQNKEFDLYAVIKFLRCSPFDELAYWKTWIETKGSTGGTARLNTLMKSLMLRRTKVELMEKGEVKDLPSKDIIKIDVTLGKEEMNVYSIIMGYSKTLFAQFLHQRAEKNIDLQMRYRNEMRDPNNEIHKLHKKFNQMFGSSTEIKAHQILMLLLRLRQICCHPGLIDSMLEDCEILEGGHDDSNNNSELDVLAQLQNLKIDENEEDQEAQYNRATQKVLNRDNPIFDFDNASSKIEKLMTVLEEKVLNTNDKAVIVSQWTSFLEVVRKHLHQKRIYCCELNGKVPVKDRNDIVQLFNKQGAGPKIMLLSLTAGGVGLNLVGANHLILLDLHWNPQLESQAQDRIYRFGQQKPVSIYKFVTAGTIEERILHLQEQKLEISTRVLTGRASKTKLTIDDLRGLFGI